MYGWTGDFFENCECECECMYVGLRWVDPTMCHCSQCSYCSLFCIAFLAVPATGIGSLHVLTFAVCFRSEDGVVTQCYHQGRPMQPPVIVAPTCAIDIDRRRLQPTTIARQARTAQRTWSLEVVVPRLFVQKLILNRLLK